MAAKLFNKLQSLLQRLAASVFFLGWGILLITNKNFKFAIWISSESPVGYFAARLQGTANVKKNDFSLVQCINYTNRAIPVFSEPWFCAGQRHPLVPGAQAPGNPIVQWETDAACAFCLFWLSKYFCQTSFEALQMSKDYQQNLQVFFCVIAPPYTIAIFGSVFHLVR